MPVRKCFVPTDVFDDNYALRPVGLERVPVVRILRQWTDSVKDARPQKCTLGSARACACVCMRISMSASARARIHARGVSMRDHTRRGNVFLVDPLLIDSSQKGS